MRVGVGVPLDWRGLQLGPPGVACRAAARERGRPAAETQAVEGATGRCQSLRDVSEDFEAKEL